MPIAPCVSTARYQSDNCRRTTCIGQQGAACHTATSHRHHYTLCQQVHCACSTAQGPNLCLKAQCLCHYCGALTPHCLCACWSACSYPYLLFGLNAAVFESGSRRLPWQTTGSLPVVKEAGSSRKAPAVASSFSYTANPTDRIRMDAQTLGPHWMSHAQHRTTSQERDHAIRKQYESMIISRT